MKKLRQWMQGNMTDDEFREWYCDLAAYGSVAATALMALVIANYYGALS